MISPVLGGRRGRRRRLDGSPCRQWRATAIAMLAGVLGWFVAAEPATPEQSAIAIEALKRLEGVDLETNPSLKAAVLKVLESTRGTPQFVELVRAFKIKDQGPALLEFALERPAEAAGVEALRLIVSNGDSALVTEALHSDRAAKLLELLGNTAEREWLHLLKPIVRDEQRNMALRKQAVHALAQTSAGADYLLDLASQSELADPLRIAAAAELRNARWLHVRARAADVLPLVDDSAEEPLPPIAELIRLKGDATRGSEVFGREVVGCNKCHQIRGRGIEFGPNLSEIGGKLAREAIYESILDPNAGISFGYEAWQIHLNNGDETFGLLTSETDDEIALKTQNGMVTRFKKTEIAKKVQQRASVMPSGLAQTMSRQDLVDLVEYLTSLK